MEPDTSELRRKPSESAPEWLERLEKLNKKDLAANQQNDLSGYLDVARVAVRAHDWNKNKQAGDEGSGP